MSDRTSAAESQGVFDVLQLVEAHCRHVAAEVPRGQPGAATAEMVAAAIPEAVRQRLPDITGPAMHIVGALVAHKCLSVLPNPKMARAVPRLLVPLTPLFEVRSARQWTLRLTQLHDPRSALVAKLRKLTPAGAFAVREAPPRARVLTQRALTSERDDLLGQVAALRAELDKARADAAAEAAALRKTHKADSDRWAALNKRSMALVDTVQTEMTSAVQALTALKDELRTERAAVADLKRELAEARERWQQIENRHADLQTFLRKSIPGSEQLALYAVTRLPRR